MLGNDFLPHFPSLNIRTSGIDRLLGAYLIMRTKDSRFSLTDLNDENGHTNIIWKNVRKLIEYLSINELTFLKEEYIIREKQSKRQNNIKNNSIKNNDNSSNIKAEEEAFLYLPSKERALEIYINPGSIGWEERYYSTLFDIKIDDKRRQEICINYLEGLEWTLHYYTSGCIDWQWTYKYSYPPLLSDLIKYVPYFDTRLLNIKLKMPINPLVQLSYVLPLSSHFLLPLDIQKKLAPYSKEWYNLDFKFKWAFCKFFWEAHAELPMIELNKLDKVIMI
jgi:5'-3' exonuclease